MNFLRTHHHYNKRQKQNKFNSENTNLNQKCGIFPNQSWDLYGYPRQRRRTQKRILFHRLKSKSPKKPSWAISRVLRTIVNKHRNGEKGNVSHHDSWNKPWKPKLKRPKLRKRSSLLPPSPRRRRFNGHIIHRRRWIHHLNLQTFPPIASHLRKPNLKRKDQTLWHCCSKEDEG